jgi:hypothetical protein
MLLYVFYYGVQCIPVYVVRESEKEELERKIWSVLKCKKKPNWRSQEEREEIDGWMKWRRERLYRIDGKRLRARVRVCVELNVLTGRIFVACDSDNDGCWWSTEMASWKCTPALSY